MADDPQSSHGDGASICALCGHIAGAGEAGRFCPADGRALVPRAVYDRFPDDTLLGKVLLGRYAVVDRVDGVGVGRRYLALERPGKGELALRVVTVPRDERADVVRDRFLARAKLLGRLQNPAFVPVIDYWIEADDNEFFVVTDLVRAQTLRVFLDAHGPLEAEAAVDLLDPVLHAFAEAHEYDFVHGDPRPQILAHEGESSTLRVLDYGLLDTLRRTKPPCTTIQDDLRALACIAYEMVTGLTVVDPAPGTTPPNAEALRMPPVLNVPDAIQTAILRGLGLGLPFDDAGEFARALRAGLLVSEAESSEAEVPEDEAFDEALAATWDPVPEPPEVSEPPEEKRTQQAAPALVDADDPPPPKRTPAPVPSARVPSTPPPVDLSAPPDALAPEPSVELMQPPDLAEAPPPAPAAAPEQPAAGIFVPILLLGLFAAGALWWVSRPAEGPDTTVVVETEPKPVVTAPQPPPAVDAGAPEVDAALAVVADAGPAPDAAVAEPAKPEPATVNVRRRPRPRPRPVQPVAPPQVEIEPAKPKGPPPLDPAAVSPVVDRVRGTVRRCQPGGAEGRVDVSFNIRPTGRVDNVVLHAAHLSGTAAGRCIQRAIMGLGFPAFTGQSMSFRMPFTVGGLNQAGGVPLPASLSRDDIASVLRRNTLRVRGCKQEGDRPGEVSIRAVIGGKGRVTSATVTKSTLSRPAEARCVASEVRKFRFPQFSGEPITVNLPFRI